MPGSIVTTKALYLEALNPVLAAQAPGGRLSLVSGDPYPQNTSGSTIYYTPYRGNRITGDPGFA